MIQLRLGAMMVVTPDLEIPAIPVVGERIASDSDVAEQFAHWVKKVCGKSRPIFVSDNAAYDFMWIAGLFGSVEMAENVFGHSGRRIGDF